MDEIERKTMQDIKDYIKSLDTSDNKVYQENSLLIMSCFSKAIEFIEQNAKLRQTTVIPRYFVDIRSGCGAVRDKWHESYDEDYPGLHGDTPDVVEYKHGYTANGVWNMKDEDVKYLNDLCERLNNEV